MVLEIPRFFFFFFNLGGVLLPSDYYYTNEIPKFPMLQIV
jgi:hypothetical protein